MITVYTLEQSEQWDSIVQSFKEYDVYWLSGYVKAFKYHGDGEPLLFHYASEDTCGINVVMKRDIAKSEFFQGKLKEGEFFDFSTPYGYGGWIVDGKGIGELFREYQEWIKENRIVSEFVRFHPLLENHLPMEDCFEVHKLGEVVYMDLSSPDIIWSNLSSKNRNTIRKASKNDIKIYNGRSPEIYRKFREVYNSTMDKDNAEKYYYFGDGFYNSVLEDLPQNAQVFWADLEGQIIAASIILAANGRLNYHLSGSLREYSSLAPNNLLLYTVALWGNENGYKSFYLGGGVGSGEDGLLRFKRAFCRGELKHFYIGKKIYDVEKYDVLVNMRGNIQSAFFPMYRA